MTQQEAHHEVGLGETPRRFNPKRYQHSSLEKFEDAFNTALYILQTKPSDATFSSVFQTSVNANQKQLVTFQAHLWGRLSSISVLNLAIINCS